MKASVIYRYIGLILLLDALFMLLSSLVSVVYDMDSSFNPLFISFIITAIVGVFPLVYVPKITFLSVKEGYLVVVLAWIVCCFFGMLPYVIWGGEFGFAEALFESTSGFTTNGASILDNVEALPKGLLFWRSSTHWIGGVGVVLFALVVLPSMGNTKVTLTSVEISSIAKDNFRFTSKNLFRIIILTYLLLTIIPVIFLYLAGMDFFDAVNHAFSIASTGGFSTKNTSIMWWNSPLIEAVTSIFLILSGTHIGLLYMAFTGRKNIFKNDVWRFYLISMFVGGLIVSWNLYSSHLYTTIYESCRYGFFQVIAYMTSAGFASADNAFWPSTSILVILVLSFGCSMAGSTSGGLKIDRIFILLKTIRHRIILMRHPNAVLRLKLGGKSQESAAVNAALIMIGFYLLAVVFSTFVISLYNYDLLTSFSISVSTLGNIGPGFGLASNLNSLSFFPDSLKLWLSFIMLFGRLELFGLINVFFISTWK